MTSSAPQTPEAEPEHPVVCEKCLKMVSPVLHPGEDFTIALCPQCGKDLTLVWYASQQLGNRGRWIKWGVAPVAGLLLVAWLTR